MREIGRWTPALALFALAVALAIAFANSGLAWGSWERVSCAARGCFCEQARPGAVAEPSNTFSNLAFVLVGLLVLQHGRHTARSAPPGGRNVMLGHRAYPLMYGAALVLLGFGSFFYHASLTTLGRWLDVMGMYLLASFIALYNWTRIRPARGMTFAAAYVLLNVALGAALALNPSIRLRLFSALIWLGIALEVYLLMVRRPAIQYRYYFAALGCFALAYGIWILDNELIVCNPYAPLQGHAIWHMLTAVAAGLIYRFYVSENGGRLL